MRCGLYLEIQRWGSRIIRHDGLCICHFQPCINNEAMQLERWESVENLLMKGLQTLKTYQWWNTSTRHSVISDRRKECSWGRTKSGKGHYDLIELGTSLWMKEALYGTWMQWWFLFIPGTIYVPKSEHRTYGSAKYHTFLRIVLPIPTYPLSLSLCFVPMPDWKLPDEIEKDTEGWIKLIHSLAGIYMCVFSGLPLFI